MQFFFFFFFLRDAIYITSLFKNTGHKSLLGNTPFDIKKIDMADSYNLASLQVKEIFKYAIFIFFFFFRDAIYITSLFKNTAHKSHLWNVPFDIKKKKSGKTVIHLIERAIFFHFIVWIPLTIDFVYKWSEYFESHMLIYFGKSCN